MAVPIDPVELDAAWFTSALSSDPTRAQVQVAAVELVPLAQQGRASRTYRARLTLRDPVPGAASSRIVKLS